MTTLHHARIPVADLARATAFWCDAFDLVVDFDFPGAEEPRGRALSARDSGARVVLWHDPARAGSQSVVVGLGVSDTESLRALADRLSVAGVCHGGIRPARIESKLIDIEDSEGNLINVYVDPS